MERATVVYSRGQYELLLAVENFMSLYLRSTVWRWGGVVWW